MTAVCTGWTELRAVQTKAQTRVFDAITVLRERLALSALGYRFRQ